MTSPLETLPNELIEHIAFYLIAPPWRNEAKDLLALASTSRRFRFLLDDQRFWKVMALRRDPTVRKVENWFEHCRTIYRLRTFRADQLEEKISRYDEEYFCTVEKVQVWPDRLRLFIDERGDNSLGPIQDPHSSIIRVGERNDNDVRAFFFRQGIAAKDGVFTIADPASRYLGYLDYDLIITSQHRDQPLYFQYGTSGYSQIVLLRFNEKFFSNFF